MNAEAKSLPLSHYPLGGKFGPYGGRFVPEGLMPALLELEAAYESAKADPAFQQGLKDLQLHYGGRPTPLYEAGRLSAYLGGATLLLKREDLLHGGAHTLNNALGQALLAKRMGKTRLVGETASGAHGVAVAMVGAQLGLRSELFMGRADVEQQPFNVRRMRLLGAHLCAVDEGALGQAAEAALEAWRADPKNTHYVSSSAVGPHPYPWMVRDFQSVIGIEIKGKILRERGQLPAWVVACVGGGGNAVGSFHPFLEDQGVQLLGVEAEACCPLSAGAIGVVHGAKTYMLRDADRRTGTAGLHGLAAGPEHALYKDAKRVEYISVRNEQALEGFHWLCRFEGIVPALESAHAVYAGAMRAKALPKDKLVVITLSGCGDKDVDVIGRGLEGLGQEAA